jgi:hypothetical protein
VCTILTQLGRTEAQLSAGLGDTMNERPRMEEFLESAPARGRLNGIFPIGS